MTDYRPIDCLLIERAVAMQETQIEEYDEQVNK